jgi:hypothetical protein
VVAEYIETLGVIVILGCAGQRRVDLFFNIGVVDSLIPFVEFVRGNPHEFYGFLSLGSCLDLMEHPAIEAYIPRSVDKFRLVEFDEEPFSAERTGMQVFLIELYPFT